MNYSRKNWVALGVSSAAAFIIISFLTVVIGGGATGDKLLGSTSSPVYPFTLQNVMHLFFFIGLGQLWVRWISSYEENLFLQKSGFLPEGDGAVLQSDEEIEAIRANVANTAVRADAFLPDLINVCLTRYLKSRSVSDTIAVLNSTLDLSLHRLDLSYSLIRYIVWAIPTFGFIGTVVGISDALGNLDINTFMGAHADKVIQFKALTADLGFAFDTTIVALSLSAVLVFLLNIIQRGEEDVLNRTGRYVMNNLINRLMLSKKQG